MNKDIQTLIEREAEEYANNCDLDFTIESEESLNEYHKVEINRAFKKGYDTYRENLKVDKPFSDMIHLAANDRWKECGYSCEDEESTNCYLDFKAGASFALSLFKWRKVSDGLPEVRNEAYQVLVYRKYKKEEYKKDTLWIIPNMSVSDSFKFHGVTEWMPIPQID